MLPETFIKADGQIIFSTRKSVDRHKNKKTAHHCKRNTSIARSLKFKTKKEN